MSDLKIKLIAEIDESSISNMTKQLKGIQEGVGKIKIDIDTNEVMSRLTQLESKMKPMDLKIDTSNVKSKLVDVNGEMQKFYTTSVKSMSSANGATQKYVTTMLNADRTLKQVTTTTKDMEGNVLNVGTAITKSFSHPIRDAQVEALKLNKNFDKIGQGLKGDLSAKLQTLAKDFRDVAPAHVTADIDRMIKSLDFSSSTFDADVKNIERAIKNLGTESKLTADELNKALGFENKTGKLSSDLQKLARDFEGVVNPQDIAELEQMIRLLNPNSTALPQELTKIRNRITEVRQESSHAKQELEHMGKATSGLGKIMGNVLKRAVGWVSLTLVIRKAFRAIGQGVKDVRELDSAMVELKKVTNATNKEYQDFFDNSFSMGKEIGRTGKEVINATADFARMGFDMMQSAELAQEALLMVNVGDGVENVDEATKAMIAALKGFKVESKDSVSAARHINDAYNEVANNFAIDTANIAEGVRRSSALMAASGNDINQTIGLVTGGFEVMQDSSKVSSGLNIIAQRLKGINDEGKNSPELVAKLKNEFKDIANIDLELPNGELKNTYTILEELAEVYPDLSSKQRAYLAELAAGKRQSVVLESIMSNWENVAKATETAKNSAGSALKENEVYMDSIDGKLSILKSSAQEFWATLINTSAVKKLVDLGTGMLESLTGVVNTIKDIKDGIDDTVKAAMNLPETLKAYDSDIEYLEGIQDEFDILNALVGENGDLSKMSADEQKRYIDIVKKLKEVSPDMEIFYNTQGDMIAGAKQDIQELIDLKNEEMRIDREKASQGLDKRLEDHGKAEEERKRKKEELEQELAMRKEIAETGRHITFDGKVIEFDEESIESNKKRVREIEKSIGGLSKTTEEEMSKTMEIIGAKIDVIGHDFESLKPHAEGFKEGFKEMLELDSSEEGIQKVSDAIDILGETYENIQTIKDNGGILPTISDMKLEVTKLTDLGMSYDVVAEGIYKTLAAARLGEEDMGTLDSALSEFNKTGATTDDTLKKLQQIFPELKSGVEGFSLDFIRQIGVTDKETAAYLTTLQKVDEGIEGLTGGIKKHVQGIKVEEVIDGDGIAKQLNEVEKASFNTIKQIEADANDYGEVLEYMYKDLGILSEAQYIEASKKNAEIANNRIEQEKRVTRELEKEVFERGKSGRENIKQVITDLSDESKSFDEVWRRLGKEEQKLVLDAADLTGAEKDLDSLLKQWAHTPEAKKLTLIDDGIEFALDNIDKLGFNWDNLSEEDKVFMAEVLGIGLDEFENFQEIWDGMSDDDRKYHFAIQNEGIEDTAEFRDMWEGMSDEQKEFFINLEGRGIEDIEDFVEQWKGLDDEERNMLINVSTIGTDDVNNLKQTIDGLDESGKELLINVLTKGTEDAEAFQEHWDNTLTTEEKKFIATTVGIDDVESSDAEAMSQWAQDPKLKKYIAMAQGLEEVRIEKAETDGIWNVTIGDVTYQTNESGAKEAQKTIKALQDFWNKIPKNDKKTKTTDQITNVITNYREMRTSAAVTSPTGAQTGVQRWTGDDDFQGGLAYVGERGRELLLYPDGSHDMTGEKAELRNLPRGTIIYNNQDTEDILKGKKNPEFKRSDKRIMGKSNTPGFADGNKKAEKVSGKNTPGFASGNTSAKNADTAKADKYAKINFLIDRQNNLLAKNNELQTAAANDIVKKAELIEKQLEMEKRHIQLLEIKNRQQRKERDQLKTKLSRQGFKFKGKGDNTEITNLAAIEGKSKEVEEMFDRFNELQFNLIPNVEIDTLKIQNQIADAVSRGFEQQTRIDINRQENQHLLEINKINIDREHDMAKRIKLRKESIKLIEREAYLSRGQANVHRREREELEKLLSSKGFRFSGKGDERKIINPEHVKGQIKEVEEALNRHNEIQFDIIPKLNIDGMKLKDDIKNAIGSIIQDSFEESDAEVDRLNKAIDRSLEIDDIVQRKDDPYWEIRANRGALEATEEKALYQYNKAWDYINQAEKMGLDENADADKIQELNDKAQQYFKDYRSAELAAYELKKTIHAAEMRYVEDEISANQKAQDEYKFRLELLADDDLEGRLDLNHKITEEEMKSHVIIKNNIKELEKQLSTTMKNTDEWHVINDSLEKYNQLLKDSTLELKKQKDELVKIAQAQADKQLDADLSTAEKSIFGGQTERDAKKILDDKIEAFEDYISGEEKALEIARIRKMVEEEGLTLTREQQDLLNQGGQVERDRLDRLNKQLNIQQLQAKLENQKNQKNIRQLVKKDDGTFDFEYVADRKAIKETEDAILESKKDLANWELKNSLDKDKKIFEEKQKLLAVEEERLQARLKAEKEAIELHYQAIMERQIAMMEMNMALMEQLNSEKSIDGWAKTIEAIIPLMDEIGINFAELMKELGIDLTDNFDVIMPLLYDMGLLHEDMVDEMGIDFEKYMDAVIPVLDELGIDHEEFLTFMGVDLEIFLADAEMTFAQYSEAVRKKNAETKADVERTKEALRVPTESTHTVKLIAPPPFSMPDSSSTHTVYTKTVGGFESGGRYRPESFDTGGYTGNFSGGKLAVLHEKEIVLNKSQSATFEKLIDIMPNMVNTFNDIGNKFKGIAPKIPKVPTSTNNNHSEETVQNFHINKLEFPNVKSADEIEKAILKLPMLAKQRVRPV